jgi:uncharacterized repeat protein (TIGR03843 family)
MSTDQRPPSAGSVNGWSPAVGPGLESATEYLHRSELSVVGRLPWSSNLTFLVALEGSAATLEPGSDSGSERGPDSGSEGQVGGRVGRGVDEGVGDRAGGEVAAARAQGEASVGEPGPGPGLLHAVYKPASGEQSLWDFPDGLYRREVAAFALSEALGWGLVPPTVERHDGPFGAGSLQLFVAADYEQHYFTLFDEGGHEEVLLAMCVFDIVANNADRKSGHVLLGEDGRLWGIDHGLCFHRQPKLRTVIWDFADEPVPPLLLADLQRLASGLPDELTRLLDDEESDAIVNRIDRLVRTGTFPEPLGDRPPYPWPLV